MLSSGVAMCVDTGGLATSCCKTHCDGCMNVAWGLCWGGSRSTKPCVFPCKVVAAGYERYLLCAAGAAAVGLPFFLPRCNGGFKLLWVCLCVRSLRVFWNLWWQIAVEWLHDCCHVLLSCVSRHAGLPRDAGKRIVMAASRFLTAVALCVLFLSFAAESCES